MIKISKKSVFISIKIKLILLLGIFSLFIFTFSIGINDFLFIKDFKNLNSKYLSTIFLNYINEINKILEAMMNNGLNIANIGEEFYTNIKKYSYDSLYIFFSNILINHLKNLPYAFGTGIWFEPYIFGKDIKWFGPYASRVDKNKIEVTMEYSNDKYNYPSHDWYKVVFIYENQKDKIPYKKSMNNIFLSAPYFDTYYGKIITFITLTVPFYYEGKIIGVSTTDWSLDVIDSILSKFFITKNSFCFFLDPFYGKILYHPDKNLVLKDIKTTQWGKFINFSNLQEGKIEICKNIIINDELYDIYFSKTSIDYIFGFCINRNEAYSFLNKMRIRNFLIVFLSSFLLLIMIYIIGNNLVQPIVNLTNTMKKITEKKFLYEPQIQKRNDEIGVLSFYFHKAFETIKEYSEKLEDSKNFLETILNNIDTPIIVLDSQFKIQQLNKTGYSFIDKNFLAFDDEKQIFNNISIFNIISELKRFEDNFKKSICENQKLELYDLIFEKIPKSVFNIFFIPMIYNQEVGVILIIQDITEIRVKDKIIQQTQKMDAIGNLASGFAHDFNNIVTGILGTISLLVEDIKEGERDKKGILEDLRLVEDFANKASNLVKQLLNLSRNAPIEKKEFKIAESIYNVKKLCEKSFPKNIKIIIDIKDGEILVFGNQNQIEQVILNICINAMHALTIMNKENNQNNNQKEPTISINLSILANDLEFKNKYPNANEKIYCQVSISDNGVGMDSDTLNKIFDPFFTTKNKEHGTGLGLSIAYNIIKNHNGYIEVYSEPGKGSTFYIYLPIYSNSLS